MTTKPDTDKLVEPSPKAGGDNELLPCPFCGGEARLLQDRDRQERPDPNGWFARCDPCDLIRDQAWGVSRDEAIAAWNTRASPDQEVERLNCDALAINRGREVTVTFANPDDAFALFNELKARSLTTQEDHRK